MTEQTQRTYSTVLRNNRKKELPIFDNQLLVTTLAPGQDATIEAVEPWSYYSRYESITWNADGTVDAGVRDGWREPARGKYVLRCLNADGKDYEQVVIGGQPYSLPHGIPVLVAVEVTDPLVTYQSIEIKLLERWAAEPGWPGYIQPVLVLEEVKIERPENELAKIRAELEELEQKTTEVQA